jgi:putative queuosine salvage protein
MALPDDVRAACERVAGRARRVRVEEAAIAAYAESLQPVAVEPASERALSLQLNAVNFGSGWFPTLRKPPGMSGFRTVEAGMRAHGPFADAELAAMDAVTIAHVLGQDPGHELMALYARALREMAGVGSFDGRDAIAIAEALAQLPMWHDVSRYDGEDVPLFKRAQIAAADLTTAGAERLTLFADNLVPHVLRLDGVLTFDDELIARIDREELLEHGSPEEVEIRACAVHAVELLVAAHGATTAAQLDHLLWTRGARPAYKARPRHRARCTAY